MLIDTHAHLNFNAYKNDVDEVIKRTLDYNPPTASSQPPGGGWAPNKVWMINVGTKYETSKKAIELTQKYPEGVYAAVGLHPIHLANGIFKTKIDTEEIAFQTKEEEFDYGKYKDLAKSKKVVAIGEIGLDYYYRPKTPYQFREENHGDGLSVGKAYSAPAVARNSNGEIGTGQAKIKPEQFKEIQRTVLCKQLDLAKELNLPVIFHCRAAHDDLINILKNHLAIKPFDHLTGVIHCFTGTWEQAKKYLEMGFYLGFNGIIFKLNLDGIIKNTPLEKILIETDCPYLTPPLPAEVLTKAGPQPIRNEPLYVKYVAERIAEIKNLSFGEIAKITTENAKKLFKI